MRFNVLLQVGRTLAWSLLLPLLIIGISNPIYSAVQSQAVDAAGPEDGADLAERVARIEALMTERMETFRAPGFSVAIVVDGEVVLARGFGVQDLETETPVDEHTLFAIGSTTKAMTAALIAQLIDQRKMGWDDPVRRFVPELELRDEAADSNVTIRDLLAHRTGLAGMDMLWYAGNARYEDMLMAIAAAEPKAPLRKEFRYHNVMYLIAGMASVQAAGAESWDDLIRDALLVPLGMTRANTSISEMQADANHAKGYKWRAAESSFERLPMRDLASVAPAGAVNASASEMAQWVRLQLGLGEVDGKRLISAERVEDMWTPVVRVGPGVEYALGWMVRSWEDHRLVTHTGGIDGFGALVSLVPDERIGFVVLANTMDSPLLGLANDIIISGLLRDEPEAIDMEDRMQWPQFEGRYRFDALGVECAVREIDGRLTIDVPGQMTFELHGPDEDGKRRFRGFDDIAIRFDRDAAGKVVSVTLLQSGLQFELPRTDVVVPPEVDARAMQWVLGRYRHGDSGLTVRMLVRNGRLAIDIPGETIYELKLPDEEERRYFRMTDRFWVRIPRESARAASIELMGAGGLIVLNRHDEVQEGDLPTVAELMENVHMSWGTEAFEALFNVTLEYDAELVHMGVRGRHRLILSGYDRLQSRLETPPFGWSHAVMHGRFAWSQSSWQPYRKLEDIEILQLRLQHPFTLLSDWHADMDSIEIRGRERVDQETSGIEVRFQPTGLSPRTVLFDERTGLPIRAQYAEVTEAGTSVRMEVRYLSWRRVEGVAMPEVYTIDNDAVGQVRMRLRDVRLNEDFAVDPFFLLEPLEEDGRPPF